MNPELATFQWAMVLIFVETGSNHRRMSRIVQIRYTQDIKRLYIERTAGNLGRGKDAPQSLSWSVG